MIMEENSNEVKAVKKPIYKNPEFYAVICVVLASIFTITVITNYMLTKELKKAVDMKNGEAVVSAYMDASSSKLKTKKYDEMIEMLLKDTIKDMNQYDFHATAEQKGANAVLEYLKNKWGTLYVPEMKGFLQVTPTIENIISAENKSVYDEFKTIYESKKNLCAGIQNYYAKNYEYAIASFSKVSDKDSCYDEAQSKLKECAGKTIENYKLDSVYDAESLNAKLSSYRSISADVSKIVDEALQSKIDEFVNQADENFKDKKPKEAVEILEYALLLSPENETLKSKRDDYAQYVDFSLCKEENVKQNTVKTGWLEFSEMDGVPTIYGHVAHIDDGADLCELTYDLKGAYDKVTGTLMYGGTGNTYSVIFTIYADGKEIYNSELSNQSTEDIELSVTGVKTLVIKAYGKRNSNYGMFDYRLKGLCATKNF